MSNDEIDPQDRDDAAGHVLHGDAAQNPTGIGGRAPSYAALRVDQEDDVEGHKKAAFTGEPEGDGPTPDGPTSFLAR